MRQKSRRCISELWGEGEGGRDTHARELERERVA